MKLLYKPEAKKQISKFSSIQKKKIIKKLNLLKDSPFAGKLLGGELRGIRSLKAWPYRIIYLIDKKQKRIIVITVLHRQSVYG